MSVQGLGEEHDGAITNMKLSQQEVYDIRNATLKTWERMLDTLIPAGGYNWQVREGGVAGTGIVAVV